MCETVVWKRFLLLSICSALRVNEETSQKCSFTAKPSNEFDFRSSSFAADISFLRTRNFYISTEESCDRPLNHGGREVPTSLKTKQVLLEQRFAVKQLKEGLQGVTKQNFAALTSLGSEYFKRDDKTAEAPAVELQIFPDDPQNATSAWKALVVPRVREVFGDKLFLCEDENQCVAEVHFERLPFRFFSLLRQWQPHLERIRSYNYFLVIFAELTFIAGGVALLAIVGYTGYFFWSREPEGSKLEGFSASKSYRLLRHASIHDAPAGKVTLEEPLEAGAKIQTQEVRIEVGKGLLGCQKYWMMLLALLGFRGPPGVWAHLQSTKGWILIANADGDPAVCDEGAPPTSFVSPQELLPTVFAFCRGSLILATSYVSSLYFAVQLEGASGTLFGFCLMLLALHLLVLHQKLASFTLGLWHAEALHEGKLLSVPPSTRWVWASFAGLGAPLLVGTLWIAFTRRRDAMAAVLALLAAGALHGFQLYSAISGRKKWREPQIRCEEFHAVRPELLPHSTEFPKQISEPRLSKLAFVQCFVGCLSIGAVGLLGLVTMDGCQVSGELVDYSFNRGYLVYPSEGQGFHNTLVLDETVDSLVVTLEAGPNTLGIELEVDHPLLPANKTFHSMEREKSGEFQVFLPAGPLYGRISVTAVGRHSNRTYVYHTLRSGSSVKMKLQGSFSRDKSIATHFQEERRLEYLQKHPKWYVPDLDREANITFQVQFSPVIYAPLVTEPVHSDTPVIAQSCYCGEELPGFGNECELEMTIEFPDSSTRCLYLRSAISNMKVMQKGSISREHFAMAEWLTGTNASGKSVAFLPWPDGDKEIPAGDGKELVFFKASRLSETQTRDSKRRLSSTFRLNRPGHAVINKPSQIFLAPTSDPTDAEAKSIPLQVISHAPPIQLGPMDHLRNMLPNFSQDGPWEYAYCSYQWFDEIRGEVIEDRRFDVRVEDQTGGNDCHGYGTRTKEFKAFRNDSDCHEWCNLYIPWAETYDLSVVQSPERCLRNAVTANNIGAIQQVVRWLGGATSKCFKKMGSLQEAIRQDRMPALTALLESKADPNQISSMHETPLGVAAMEGHLDALKLLLKHNASINQRDGSGETPLFGAGKHCQAEAVRLLLEHRSNVDIESPEVILPNEGCNATALVASFMHRATKSKGCQTAGSFQEVVQLFKERNASLKTTSASRMCDYTGTLLMKTLKRQDLEAFRLLLDGADSVDAKELMDVLVSRPLSTAFKVEALKLLVGRGAKIDGDGGVGEVAPLISFAAVCDAEMVKACLDLGADPKVQVQDGDDLLNASQLAGYCENAAELNALFASK